MNATKDVNACSVVVDCWQQLKAGILNLRYSFVPWLTWLICWNILNNKRWGNVQKLNNNNVQSSISLWSNYIKYFLLDALSGQAHPPSHCPKLLLIIYYSISNTDILHIAHSLVILLHNNYSLCHRVISLSFDCDDCLL